MKKFFKFAAVAAIAAAFVSCGNEKPGPEPGPDTPSSEYTQDLKFTLELKEVDTDQAKVVVEHNGTTKDSWYGFATTETDIDKAIADALSQENVKLQKKTKYTMTVKNLEPETDYTFVAVGVTADGKTYGEVATLEFTTEAEETSEGFKINNAWEVAYTGKGEINGKTYEHTITVTSTDNNYYFITVCSKADYDEFGAEELIKYTYDYLNTELPKHDITWDDVLYKGKAVEAYELEAGDYIAMAVGVGSDHQLSGLYSVSQPITITEAEMTEAYAAWIGDWTFTGANGVTQNVTFSKGTANKTFKMSGYEGPDAEGLDVIVDWIEEESCWVIYNQKLGTFDFGSYGPGDIWFLGEDAEENLYLAEIPICIGGTFEDGSLGAIGYEEEYEAEDGTPATYKVHVMEYIALLTNSNQLSYITETYKTGYPTFPLTITPATKATQTSVKEFKGGKKILNPFTPKTFKTYSICDKSFRTR